MAATAPLAATVQKAMQVRPAPLAEQGPLARPVQKVPRAARAQQAQLVQRATKATKAIQAALDLQVSLVGGPLRGRGDHVAVATGNMASAIPFALADPAHA